LGTLIAGPLADFVMEPAMQQGGVLVGLFGGLVGTGPGSGMSLIIILMGLAAATVGLSGYGIRAIRYAEDILPDHKRETIDIPASQGEQPETGTALQGESEK
jgi:MFS transporter, DHA3 family, macrolide efflux protein